VTKQYVFNHASQTSGSCAQSVVTATECFDAAVQLELTVDTDTAEARSLAAKRPTSQGAFRGDDDSCLSLSIDLNGTQCSGACTVVVNHTQPWLLRVRRRSRLSARVVMSHRHRR
jgi:hypothetical protein